MATGWRGWWCRANRLRNFRVRGVYSPTVYRALTEPLVRSWGEHRTLVLWRSREEAEEVAATWNAVQVAQSGVRRQRRRGDLVAAVLRLAGHQDWPVLGYAVHLLVESLFGDPPGLAGAVGTLLRDQREVAAVEVVVESLRSLVEDLGTGGGAEAAYLRDPRWPEVTSAAEAASVLLTSPPLRR